jgi:hypothetical protein
MSEDTCRKCSRCSKTQPLDNFDEGKALCQKCSEYKQRYRENHRDELRQKTKEHYAQYREIKLEKQKEKCECPICKIEISRQKMPRHERTKRHKNNLNKTNNKQIEQHVLSDKEKTRIKHQETIDYLNDVFPSFQTPD